MEHDIKYLNAEEAIATANLDLDIKKEEYSQVHALERKKNKGNPGEGVPAASKSLVAAKTAYNKVKQAVEATKLAAMMEIAKAFELSGNLLSNEARQPWDKIIQPKQLNVPWKTSTESLMTKLLPRPGTPVWSVSRSTYNRGLGMTQVRP
jgi:hypothetical protein